MTASFRKKFHFVELVQELESDRGEDTDDKNDNCRLDLEENTLPFHDFYHDAAPFCKKPH